MVREDGISQIHKKIVWAIMSLAAVLSIGTSGYWLIGDRQYSILDCFYMTMITISTIGFTEVIDLSNNPYGRVFTIFLALSGIGILTYLLSNFTASVVEGELNEALRRKKMEKIIQKYKDHFIVCGVEGVGHYIVGELRATQRPFVIVDSDQTKIGSLLETFPDQVFIQGDATDNSIQLKAGIERARGLFAATGDDNQNLVITLTAKQLNPKVKVVARCREVKNLEKMKKAGADDVVFTTLIGALRMASVMVRPTVVSFLDVMLRDNKDLRIEETPVPESLVGSPLSALNLENYPNILLLAVKRKDDFVYNPPRSFRMNVGDVLIMMATPEERTELQRLLASGG